MVVGERIFERRPQKDSGAQRKASTVRPPEPGEYSTTATTPSRRHRSQKTCAAQVSQSTS